MNVGKIVMFVVGLVVAGALLPTGIVAIANTTALTAGGVPATTIAVYGVLAIIAVVGFLLIMLKSVR